MANQLRGLPSRVMIGLTIPESGDECSTSSGAMSVGSWLGRPALDITRPFGAMSATESMVSVCARAARMESAVLFDTP